MIAPLHQQVNMLNDVIVSMDTSSYTAPVRVLSGATVGQHTRHILEVMACLQEGCSHGVVSYARRKRDHLIETDIPYAQATLQKLKHQWPDADSTLRIHSDVGEDLIVETASSFSRELVYVLEHTIHHMAFIKVACIELGIESVSPDFGVAYNTRNYRKQLDSGNGLNPANTNN